MLNCAVESRCRLPTATGCLAGACNVDRAHRICLACSSGAVGDESTHLLSVPAQASLRQQHADLFVPCLDSMRSFAGQQDHLRVLNPTL